MKINEKDRGDRRSNCFFGILVAPIGRRGSIGRIFGGTLVARGCGNSGNSDSAIPIVECGLKGRFAAR